jgi:Flp pilus assembly protein TadG
MLVPLMALIAFSVDVGYMVRVKAELQNAADAAALAGACELMQPNFSGIGTAPASASASIAKALAEAQRFAKLNSAGKKTLSLLPGDTTIGYMANPANQQQTLNAWASGDLLPNSVRVLMRRDGTANTPVPLYFAKALGYGSWNGTATATAAFLQKSTVTGFKSTTANAKLLPIALDVALWNSFLATGLSPDGTRSDSFSATLPTPNNHAPGNVSASGDGIPEFNDAYPNKNSPGNFGLVDIGPDANDTNAFRTWLNNGASPSDLNHFGPDGLQATPGAPAILKGGPGLKSTLEFDLAGVVGQPRIVPLFSSYSGSGSNTQYTIVGFAGITIVSATGQGSNMQVVVQPVAVIDPTATTGSGGGSKFVYPAPPISLVR